MNQEFYAYYSTLPTVELLQIEANRQQYQPEAVEAALFVLQSRTVTGEDQQALADIATAEQEQAERKKEKREALKAMAVKVADTARPGVEKTADQQLILFCVGLGIIYLYTDYKQFYYLYRAIKAGHFLDWYTLASLVEVILTPVMILLLYKKKKAGWTIAVFLYIAALLFVLGEVLMAFGGPGRYFRGPTVSSVLISLFVEGGIIYYLNTPKFMGLFDISRKWQRYTIVWSIIVTLAVMLLMV